MFIVWRRNSLTYHYTLDWQTKLQRASLTAQLSTSKRVDGKPKRIPVVGLGHIEEARIDCHPDRAAFWYQADTGLSSVDITDEERARFKGALEERVPRPDVVAMQERELWLDLLVQDARAAYAWSQVAVEQDEISSRQRLAKYVIDFRQAERKFNEFWDGLVSQMERRHRAELDAFHQEHDIAMKPFDYSQLPPDVAERIQSAATRLHDLEKGM